jgi:hypothetical protein
MAPGYGAAVTASPIVLFLSTGRCGTQWVTAGLRELHPRVAAEHEPIGPLYKPRRYFRCYDNPKTILEVPEVARHLDRVAREPRAYVETGWPLFAALPLFAERFGERLRVVHLTRHPVPSALSHLAHNSYAGSARDDAYTRWATLGPSDPGVLQTGYAERWGEMSPYEKCLFWWTEVHLYGLEAPGRLDGIPFLVVRSEDVLGGSPPALERLLEFMDLRWSAGWVEHARRVVDRWHHHTDADVDPLQVLAHPAAVDTAARLGYDAAELDRSALAARYAGRPDPGLDRIGRYA